MRSSLSPSMNLETKLAVVAVYSSQNHCLGIDKLPQEVLTLCNIYGYIPKKLDQLQHKLKGIKAVNLNGSSWTLTVDSDVSLVESCSEIGSALEIDQFLLTLPDQSWKINETAIIIASLIYTNAQKNLREDWIYQLIPRFYQNNFDKQNFRLNKKSLNKLKEHSFTVLIRDSVFLMKFSHRRFSLSNHALKNDGKCVLVVNNDLLEACSSFHAANVENNVDEAASFRSIVSLTSMTLYLSQEKKKSTSFIVEDTRELFNFWKGDPSFKKLSKKSKKEWNLISKFALKEIYAFGSDPIVFFDEKYWKLEKRGEPKTRNKEFLYLLELDNEPKEHTDMIVKVPDDLFVFIRKIQENISAADHQEFKYNCTVPEYKTLEESFCMKLAEFYKVYSYLVQIKIEGNLLGDRSEFKTKLQMIIDKKYPNYCIVELFGSSINNLGFRDSDVDVTVIPLDSDFKSHPLLNIYEIMRILRKAKMHIVETIAGARVPIIKFIDPEMKLEVDINIGHSLGFYNSKLLRAYTELDPRVKPLIMLVKLWAKLRDLNDPSIMRSISSYSYSLMVIAFMQKNKLIPSLQNEYNNPVRQIVKVPRTNHIKTSSIMQVDVSFALPEKNENIVQDDDDIWTGENGVANLFYKFFRYFGYEHEYDNTVRVSVRTGDGILTNQKPLTSNKFALVVEDPFELDRNCTGNVVEILPVFIMECRQAMQLLSTSSLDAFEKILRDRKPIPRFLR